MNSIKEADVMTGKEIFKNTDILTDENFERVLPFEGEVLRNYYSDLKDCIEVLKKSTMVS